MAATFPQRALLGVDPFDHALNLPRVMPLCRFIWTPRPKAVRRCRLTDVQDIAQLATEGGAALAGFRSGLRPQWVMYGRRPRCKRNLTISEAFGCGHVFGL